MRVLQREHPARPHVPLLPDGHVDKVHPGGGCAHGVGRAESRPDGGVGEDHVVAPGARRKRRPRAEPVRAVAERVGVVGRQAVGVACNFGGVFF